MESESKEGSSRGQRRGYYETMAPGPAYETAVSSSASSFASRTETASATNLSRTEPSAGPTKQSENVEYDTRRWIRQETTASHEQEHPDMRMLREELKQYGITDEMFDNNREFAMGYLRHHPELKDEIGNTSAAKPSSHPSQSAPPPPPPPPTIRKGFARHPATAQDLVKAVEAEAARQRVGHESEESGLRSSSSATASKTQPPSETELQAKPLPPQRKAVNPGRTAKPSTFQHSMNLRKAMFHKKEALEAAEARKYDVAEESILLALRGSDLDQAQPSRTLKEEDIWELKTLLLDVRLFQGKFEDAIRDAEKLTSDENAAEADTDTTNWVLLKLGVANYLLHKQLDALADEENVLEARAAELLESARERAWLVMEQTNTGAEEGDVTSLEINQDATYLLYRILMDKGEAGDVRFYKSLLPEGFKPRYIPWDTSLVPNLRSRDTGVITAHDSANVENKNAPKPRPAPAARRVWTPDEPPRAVAAEISNPAEATSEPATRSRLDRRPGRKPVKVEPVPTSEFTNLVQSGYSVRSMPAGIGSLEIQQSTSSDTVACDACRQENRANDCNPFESRYGCLRCVEEERLCTWNLTPRPSKNNGRDHAAQELPTAEGEGAVRKTAIVTEPPVRILADPVTTTEGIRPDAYYTIENRARGHEFLLSYNTIRNRLELTRPDYWVTYSAPAPLALEQMFRFELLKSSVSTGNYNTYTISPEVCNLRSQTDRAWALCCISSIKPTPSFFSSSRKGNPFFNDPNAANFITARGFGISYGGTSPESANGVWKLIPAGDGYWRIYNTGRVSYMKYSAGSPDTVSMGKLPFKTSDPEALPFQWTIRMVSEPEGYLRKIW